MPSRFHALTVATVVKVRDPNVTYPYCIVCYCKLQSNLHSRIWRCSRCQIGYNVCNIPQRYRLCLEIADGSALCGATVFGKSLEPYFGGSAEEIHSLFCLYDSNYRMDLLNYYFTGKSFLFGFKTLQNLQKSHFNMSLLSVLKSSCQKHCETLPTDLIACQMINCNIGMKCTIKILLTENNSFKTQNTLHTLIEPILQTPIASVPPESPLFIEQTNNNSSLPLISQELIVLSYKTNPSGSQTSRNLSSVLISSSGVSKTPNLINSCPTKELSLHVTKSHPTETYESFIINSFPDFSGNILNHLLHSDKKVPSGSHASIKHLPEASFANIPNEGNISYISDCEATFLDETNASNVINKYSPGVTIPIPQKEHSMECSLNVNTNNVSYAPESEDLEAFLNSFNNSPHSQHDHSSEFHEKTEQNQMHKTQSNKNQICFLNGYNFKTPLKVTSCNQSNLKMSTVVAASNIKAEETCEPPTQAIYWETREINVLSLLSFHSSTVTYFLLNLSVPYRFLKCIWKDNFFVSNNPMNKNRDKLNRSNQFIEKTTCYSELMMHNHKVNSLSDANQLCNKMIKSKLSIDNDNKPFVKNEDLCLSSYPVKIVTITNSNNENISNIYSKYPTKISCTNEFLPKLQSTKRRMSTLNSTNDDLFRPNFIEETSPKIRSSCSIYIPCDSRINLSTMSPFHINRLFSKTESINGSVSTSGSFKQLSPFQELIHSSRHLSKRLPNQDSNIESGPSVLNQSKKRMKCNQCRLYLPKCMCNDFSQNKENVSYNGEKEVLCFSKKLIYKNMPQSEQFVKKAVRTRNKKYCSVPSKKRSHISSTIMKSQFSDLPYSTFSDSVKLTGQDCSSLPNKHIDNSGVGFHTFSTNINPRKCRSLTSTPVLPFHIYQPSDINEPHKDSSTGEYIESLFPITPIKCSSENQGQSCQNSPSIFSVESYIAESHVLPAARLQQVCQESHKEEDDISQDLFDSSTELFLPSPNPADAILPVDTLEDLFSYSLKSPNHIIPQTPSNTPVSVRNISINNRDGINKTFNHQKSKYSLSKCLLKRQMFKKINNSNKFQTRCKMKKLSSSNTIPKTTSIPSSPVEQHNRKDQTFTNSINSSEEILETYTGFKPLFSPRILSQNEFGSPRVTNYIDSKEISKCNSLIISKAMGNIFQNVEQSPESKKFRKTILESQDLFSPEILPATQDKTKRLFTFQNTNTSSLDNPFYSCFKLKTGVNQQQTPPKLFKETPGFDVTTESLDTGIVQESYNVSNQNTTETNFKMENNTYLYKRTPMSCNKMLDIYASPDLFCTQQKDPNVRSHHSEHFSHVYQDVEELPQSPDIFTSTSTNTSVLNETPDIHPVAQTCVDYSIQSPDIYNETEANSCNQLLSSSLFSSTKKNNQNYLLHSISPVCDTPENTKHYLLSPDIFSQTQKNTQDHMKSPEIFSQTQEPYFKHKNKYLYSWNQISSPTKTADLQHKDTL